MRQSEIARVGLPLDRDQAVVALFRAHHARLVAHARLLVDDVSTAEDVVQDAFTALHHRWGSLRDPEAALTYLRTAVTNGARDTLRRRRTVRAFRPEPPPDEVSAEVTVVRRDEHRRALLGLRTLPRRQREVLVLRYFYDLDEAQIAHELGVSRGSVKQHASRGLAALTSRMAEVAP